MSLPGVPQGYRTLSPYRVPDIEAALAFGAGGGASFPAMLHVYVEDADAVYERALAAGATSAAEPHGNHRAAFDDPWGRQWWVGTRMAS